MSKRVYRVKYQEKWDDIREWMDGDAVNVLARDAEQAIVAARKSRIGVTMGPEEKGGKSSKIVGFRLIGVESIAVVEVIA